MKDIMTTCNSTVRFSKFICNKKICEKFEGFFSKHFPPENKKRIDIKESP